MEIKTVINAAGKMTKLGGSTSTPSIAKKMEQAAQHYYVIDDLYDLLDKKIAEKTGAEAGLPTSSASAGIVLSVAGVVTDGTLCSIESIPFQSELKEIIIQKGHVISFGAPITQLIKIGGGTPVEVGTATNVSKNHIIGSINKNTAGILYVKSHHTVQDGLVSLKECIEISKEYHIPIIVDAAAEENLLYYISQGADLVIYSGSKAVGAPTSGFIAGKRELVQRCRLNYSGVGRPMKIGKEALIGLNTALDEYDDQALSAVEQMNRLVPIQKVIDRLNRSKEITFDYKSDDAGRDITRGVIKFSKNSPLSAKRFAEKLSNSEPKIYTRSHTADLGYIQIDPRTITQDEANTIAGTIKDILSLY